MRRSAASEVGRRLNLGTSVLVVDCDLVQFVDVHAAKKRGLAILVELAVAGF
jgi:hypothetical protein